MPKPPTPKGGRTKTRADGSPRIRNLDTERIAAAALALVDERGSAALTMRAVAEKLGVTPMSLYHHVADKSGLVALVVDRVITECALPEGTGRGWQDDLCVLGHWMRDRLLAHPATTQLRRQHQVWSSAIFAVGERWLQIWSDSGLPPEAALRAANTSAMAVLGVLEEQMLPRFAAPDESEMDAVPHMREFAAAQLELSDDFELLLRALADGLYTQLAGKHQRSRTKASKRKKP